MVPSVAQVNGLGFNSRLLDQINSREFEEVFDADVVWLDHRDVFVVRGALKSATDDYPLCVDLYAMDGDNVGEFLGRHVDPGAGV